MHSNDHDIVCQCPARETGPSTARHERNVQLGEQAHDGDSLIASSGENRQPGLPSISWQTVRVINQQLARPTEDMLLSYDIGQSRREIRRVCNS